jgi:hypothetical protein
VALWALPAAADTGIALAWGDCAPNGSRDVITACSSDAGSSTLLLSLESASAIPDVIGWILVLDLAADSSVLPPWWQFQGGGCRSGRLQAASPTGFELDCADQWSAAGSSAVQSFQNPRPGGTDAQARVLVAMAVPSNAAFTVAPDQSQLAARLVVSNVGTTTCAGCTTPVCLVFNSAEVQSVGASGIVTTVISAPLTAASNQVSWRSGSACAAVPVRARTWGQIKALYR